MNKILNLGIIGAGRVAPSHVSATQAAGLKFQAVAELDEAKLSAFVAEYGGKGYLNYEEMLEKESLDVVCVALPPWLNCEATVKAAEAGAHVLVEKPMAMSLEECDQMIETARRHDVKLMVGHTYHFHPLPVAAKKILDSGELGKIVLATDTLYNIRRPDLTYSISRGEPMRLPDWCLNRDKGGGMLMTNGVHLIDRMKWFIGSSVVAVKAMVGTYMHRVPADDSALILLHFANGVYASISMSGLYAGARRFEAEFVCTKGMLKFGPELWVAKTDSYEKVEFASYNGFNKEWEAFVKSILEDTDPPVTGEWGRAVMAVLFAAEKSSKTGKEVRLEY